MADKKDPRLLTWLMGRLGVPYTASGVEPMTALLDFKEFSNLGESEGDFRGRLVHLVHEKRDLQVEKLRTRYAPKLARLQERLRKAQVRVERERAQLGQQKIQTAVSVGATLLGALFGRKTMSTGTIGRATTGMRDVGRLSREKQDIARAQRETLVIQEKLAMLEEEFQSELADLREEFQPEELELQEILIRPRKTDIFVQDLTLVWIPWKISQDGFAEPAFDLK